MDRKVFLTVLVLLSFAAFGFAQTPDFLKAGGWEFGGNFMYSFRPDSPPFAADLTEDDKGDYVQTIDAGANAGIFLADGFSLSLRPSLFWYGDHSVNSSNQVSTYGYLTMGVGVEPRYYIPLMASLTISVGGEFYFGIQPGLDGLSSDMDDPDDSLSLNFGLEPKVAVYYFIGDNVAPFAEAGYKFMYTRYLNNSDGSAYEYPDGASLFDDVYTRFNFTIGLKFFLPSGSRASQVEKTTFNDMIDKNMMK